VICSSSDLIAFVDAGTTWTSTGICPKMYESLNNYATVYKRGKKT
jgi:hypothetical protein